MPGYTAEVDPACAICAAPATHKCGCEADALEVAIAQAEERFIRPAYTDVRCWVRARARDYILAYFHIISEPCKDAYSARIQRLLSSSSSSSHHHHHRHHRRNNPPPSSSSSSSSAAALAAERYYRADIDRAWVLAVKHYPEVLDYFYSLVHVSLPDDRDPAVRDPPALDRLTELRRVPTRRGGGGGGGGGGSSSDHRRRSAPQFPIPPLPAPPLQPPMAVPWPPPRQRPPPPPPPPPPSTPLHPHLPLHPASFPPPPPGPGWTYPYPPH